MVVGWFIRICIHFWNCRWEWCKRFSTRRALHQWYCWKWLCCFEILRQPCQRKQKIFFDNYFTSPELHVRLKEKEIYSVSTPRVNRSRYWPLSNENNLKKKGRGIIEELIDINNGIFVCAWYDNKRVVTMSNCLRKNPVSECDRYDRSQKKKDQTTAPCSSCPSLQQIYEGSG